MHFWSYYLKKSVPQLLQNQPLWLITWKCITFYNSIYMLSVFYFAYLSWFINVSIVFQVLCLFKNKCASKTERSRKNKETQKIWYSTETIVTVRGMAIAMTENWKKHLCFRSRPILPHFLYFFSTVNTHFSTMHLVVTL